MNKLIKLTFFTLIIFIAPLFIKSEAYADNTFTTAYEIKEGETKEGSIIRRTTSSIPTDYYTYYKINLDCSKMLKITLIAPEPSRPLYLRIFDCNGTELYSALTSGENTWGFGKIERYFSMSKGINYIAVSPLWSDGKYKLSVSEDKREDSNTLIAGYVQYLKDAKIFKPGNTLYDTLRKYQTCYRFDVDSQQVISFDFFVLDDLSKGDAMVTILDSNGKKIAEIKNGSNTYLPFNSLIKPYNYTNTFSRGTYYLVVKPLWNSYTDSARYKVETKSIKPVGKPIIKAVENDINGIKISWNLVPEATSYTLYKKSQNGTVSATIDIKNPNASSYLDRNVTNGIKYTYTIVARNSHFKTANDKKHVICRVKRSKITSIKKKNKSTALVKWSKNKKASYYIIEYSTDKNFKNVKKVNVNGKETSLTIKGLSKKNYYFRIKTVIKAGAKYSSVYSKPKTLKMK